MAKAPKKPSKPKFVADELYTAVQHSGAGYADKKGFEKGLEPRAISNATERDLVKKAGGLIFAGYSEASAYCETEMFPPDHRGIYPKAPGKFASKMMVDGLKVYLPPAVPVS